MKKNYIWFFTALCFLSAPLAQALDVSDAGRFKCVSGDCQNGTGAAYDLIQSQTIEGAWQNGNTIPGQRYMVSHPMIKGKFEQFYGKDGLLEKGTMIRGLGALNSVPVFTGTFGRVDHPFVKARLAVPLEGVYKAGNGIEYHGRFQYLPAKNLSNKALGVTQDFLPEGNFIFFGKMVDLEDGTKETGLFVSRNAVPGGTPILFMKAQPDYMAVLQEQYQRDTYGLDTSIKQQETRSQDSGGMWKTVFSVLGEVAKVVPGMDNIGGAIAKNIGASAGLSNNAVNNFAIDLVGKAINNKLGVGGDDGKSSSASSSLVQDASKSLLGKLNIDKALAEKLSHAVAKGIENARKQKD